jgi:hypothetical protein
LLLFVSPVLDTAGLFVSRIFSRMKITEQSLRAGRAAIGMERPSLGQKADTSGPRMVREAWKKRVTGCIIGSLGTTG